jgi:hypothetical protein
LLSVFKTRGRKSLTGQKFSQKSFILSDDLTRRTGLWRIERVQNFPFWGNFFARVGRKTPAAMKGSSLYRRLN